MNSQANAWKTLDLTEKNLDMSVLDALVLMYDGASSGYVTITEGNEVEGLVALPFGAACC